MPTRLSTKTKPTKSKKKKVSRPRLQEDPELNQAVVNRLQNDIRELVLARNNLLQKIDSVDQEISAMREKDPFVDAKAVLAKNAVGNLRPKDLMPKAGTGNTTRRKKGKPISVDEEIQLLRNFLEKNKFNQVSVEAAIRELDKTLAAIRKKVDKIPLEHRETSSDKRIILQGMHMRVCKEGV